MNQLLKAIELARERMREYRDALHKNEALTRYVLVDPILRALGWDTEDPEKVEPEFPTQTGIPDYALKWGRHPQIMVEVKPLQEKLESARGKGFQYCWTNKVPFYVITDGDAWEIYDLREMGGKQLVNLRLSEGSAGEVARKLLALWYPAMPTIEPSQKPVVSPPLPSPAGISLAQLKDHVKPGDKSPQRVHFPNGVQKELKNWKGLLIAVAEWVLPELKDKLPIRLGPKRFLLYSQPHHPRGNPFKAPEKVGSFWLETHFSARDCVRYSCRLLEAAGTSLGGVQIEL